MDLDYIKGVNLGNWLVLEKWMNPALFDGTTADDEYYLPTQLDPAVYEARIRTHRAEYINERDFATIKSWGLNSVRIPVPYFIFGDRAPFIGCIDELDKAFNWAEKYGLTILIDLHTAPMSQNGFDNGGISGVCKWAQLPDEVEFVLSVLERLARRYGHRRALMGIEIINEPNTTTCWPMANVTERYKAVDPELAEGTGPIAFDWLKNFYITAYHRLRDADKGALPADKAVVFHDGFDIEQWKDFMRGPDGKLAPEFKNVVLDTHQYLMTAETMGCPQTAEGLRRLREEYLCADDRRDERILPGDCGGVVPVQLRRLRCGHPRRTKRAQRRGRRAGRDPDRRTEALAVPGRGRIPARRMEQGQRLLLLELQAAHRHRQHPWLDRLGRMGPRALHRPRLVPRPKVIPSDARIVQSNA